MFFLLIPISGLTTIGLAISLSIFGWIWNWKIILLISMFFIFIFSLTYTIIFWSFLLKKQRKIDKQDIENEKK